MVILVPKMDSSLTVCCALSKKNKHIAIHDEMNGACFHERLESVFPRLKTTRLLLWITIYHSVYQQCKCLNANTMKADIIAWLDSKVEIVDPSMVIRELNPID